MVKLIESELSEISMVSDNGRGMHPSWVILPKILEQFLSTVNVKICPDYQKKFKFL